MTVLRPPILSHRATRFISLKSVVMGEGPAFRIGDVVALSELGRERSKWPDRKGIVIGLHKTSSRVSVLWSGLKRPVILHRNLLEPAGRPDPAAGRITRDVVQGGAGGD